MARPEDLIVFKAIAGRPKDLEDATALLVLYPKLDHARLRERVRQLAALADEPELATGLETAIATSTKKKERVRGKPKGKPSARTTRRTTGAAGAKPGKAR